MRQKPAQLANGQMQQRVAAHFVQLCTLFGRMPDIAQREKERQPCPLAVSEAHGQVEQRWFLLLN
jgi:hypothetical protein